MKDVTTRLKSALKEFLSENLEYSVEVLSVTSETKFPEVVFEIGDDIEKARANGSLESYSKMVLVLDIYTKDIQLGTQTKSRRTVANEIKEQIKYLFGDCYGFKRTLSKPTPNVDSNIYRITMRYEIMKNDNSNLIY